MRGEGSIMDKKSQFTFEGVSPEEFVERYKKLKMLQLGQRPSVNEEKIFERFIKEAAAEQRDNPKMVVLGVTPELRKFGHKYGYQVTCVDFSQLMIDAMEILMGEEGEQDVIVRCSWLETPLQRGQYDIVVGDGSVCMLELKDYDRLFKICNELLKPGGYFVQRIAAGTEDPISLLDLLKRFGKQIFKHPEKHIFNMMYTSLTPEKNFKGYLLKEQLEKLCENGHITKDEFDKTWMLLEPIVARIDISIPKQEHFERIFSKYFKIKGLDFDKKLFNLEETIIYLPIYCGVKRS